MTPTQDWAALHERVARLHAVSAVVVTRPDRGAEADLLGVPHRLNLTNDLSADLRSRVRSRIDGHAGLRVVPYDVGHRPDDSEIIGLRIGDVDGLGEFRESIRGDDLDSFDSGTANRRKLLLNGVVLGRGADSVVCLQQFSSRQILKRDTILYLIHQHGVYRQLEEDGFSFDLNFDLFLSGDSVFARNKSVLERVMRYMDQVRQFAETHARSMAAKIPLSNPDVFVRACCSDLRMAAKVASIVRRPTFASLTVPRIRRHVTHHGLTIPVDDGGRFVFSNAPEERWQLLKLLDDDYLDSQLTDAKYEVNSKVAR
jgi:hypothetical protein